MLSFCKDGGYFIKKAEWEDIIRMVTLFQDTLSRVNSKDYTLDQIRVWGERAGSARWEELFQSDLVFLLAEDEKGTLLGFASINSSGYLHSMFVHADFQRQGIARRLLEEVEAFARENNTSFISAEVSITAFPFFCSQGFECKEEQLVELNGVTLKNFRMEKILI